MKNTLLQKLKSVHQTGGTPTPNLVRALIGSAISAGRWVAENRKKAMLGVVSSGIAAAKWMLANEAFLLEKFASKPAMLDVLIKTLNFLKTLPLASL